MRVESLSVDMPFEKWLLEEGIRLVAKERPLPLQRSGIRPKPWYVVTEPRIEISSGYILASVHGDGENPQEALMDLQRRIRGRRIVVNAGRSNKREIQCPNNWGENYTFKEDQ